jgi:hypothetical protein
MLGIGSSMMAGGLWNCWFKRRGLPPGPMPWPLMGLFLSKNNYPELFILVVII